MNVFWNMEFIVLYLEGEWNAKLYQFHHYFSL